MPLDAEFSLDMDEVLAGSARAKLTEWNPSIHQVSLSFLSNLNVSVREHSSLFEPVAWCGAFYVRREQRVVVIRLAWGLLAIRRKFFAENMAEVEFDSGWGQGLSRSAPASRLPFGFLS